MFTRCFFDEGLELVNDVFVILLENVRNVKAKGQEGEGGERGRRGVEGMDDVILPERM